MTATQTHPEAEPSPEFNNHCSTLIASWRKGQIAPEQVITGLTDLYEQAVAMNHWANQGRAQHLLGYMAHYLGKLATSIIHYEKARSLFMRVDNQIYVAKMDLNQGENYRYKGEFARARRLYRSAYENARQRGDIVIQSMAIVNEGLVLITTKDYKAAKEALDEGLRLTEALNHDLDRQTMIRCEIHSGLATVALNLGDIDSAWQHARQSLAYAEQNGNQLEVGTAYRILAEVITAQLAAGSTGVQTNPDDYYRAAMVAFDEIEAEAENARTFFSRARSLAVRGKRLQAAQMFREAMVRFTQLGMNDDAAKAAEAQLSVL